MAGGHWRSTTRYIIDEAAFRNLAKGETLLAGPVEIVLSPNVSWLRMAQCVLDAARSGVANRTPHPLAVSPQDPPQAREFLPNKYTRRPE